MKELSLNILDIAQNSVKAGAKLIGITIDETETRLSFTITDDGCGMTASQVAKLENPFFTTRTTRKVGLGVPFLKLAAEQSGGEVKVTSRAEAEYPETHGTEVYATFDKTNIDYTPLGDFVSTVTTLIQGADKLDYRVEYKTEKGSALLDTREMREMLGDLPLSSPDILVWAGEYLTEQINEIKYQ